MKFLLHGPSLIHLPGKLKKACGRKWQRRKNKIIALENIF
jgi:hypothetical protein